MAQASLVVFTKPTTLTRKVTAELFDANKYVKPGKADDAGSVCSTSIAGSSTFATGSQPEKDYAASGAGQAGSGSAAGTGAVEEEVPSGQPSPASMASPAGSGGAEPPGPFQRLLVELVQEAPIEPL